MARQRTVAPPVHGEKSGLELAGTALTPKAVPAAGGDRQHIVCP